MKGKAGFGLLFLFALWTVGHAAQAPGRWVTKASMPTLRTEVTAAVLGGKVYVIGGFGGAGGLVEVYDPAHPARPAAHSGRIPLHKFRRSADVHDGR